MAFPTAQVLGVVGSLFGGGADPNAGRYRQADDLYQQALTGNIQAEVQLRILSGLKDPRGVTYGFVTASQLASTQFNSGGWATQAARDYGKSKVAALDGARHAVGGATGTTPPLPNPNSLAGQSLGLGGEYGGVPTWAWLAGIGGIGYLLVQQAKR